jgi:hypothetical protein
VFLDQELGQRLLDTIAAQMRHLNQKALASIACTDADRVHGLNGGEDSFHSLPLHADCGRHLIKIAAHEASFIETLDQVSSDDNILTRQVQPRLLV